MVIGFNANCLEKFGQQVKNSVVKAREVLACTNSLTNYRSKTERLGFGAMSQLFKLLVRPLGTAQTPGVFLFGLRVMALDATVLDVPDTPANALL
jgi:hypothetical protein